MPGRDSRALGTLRAAQGAAAFGQSLGHARQPPGREALDRLRIRGVPTPRGRAFTVLAYRIADAGPLGNADRLLGNMAHTVDIVPFWPT